MKVLTFWCMALEGIRGRGWVHPIQCLWRHAMHDATFARGTHAICNTTMRLGVECNVPPTKSRNQYKKQKTPSLIHSKLMIFLFSRGPHSKRGHWFGLSAPRMDGSDCNALAHLPSDRRMGHVLTAHARLVGRGGVPVLVGLTCDQSCCWVVPRHPKRDTALTLALSHSLHTHVLQQCLLLPLHLQSLVLSRFDHLTPLPPFFIKLSK